MIKAEVDMAELEMSLKKAAKKFGDSNEQMLYRWGVQCAREAAVETQPWGGRKGKDATKAKNKGKNSIEKGLLAICIPVKGVRKSKTGKTIKGTTMNGKPISFPVSRYYESAERLDQYWQSKRTRKWRRTRKDDMENKVAAPLKVYRATLKKRLAHGGMAKGAWIQAGHMIAAMQKGAERIKIGKGFIRYAQKQRGNGRIRIAKGDGFHPAAWLVNMVPYTKSPHVMNQSRVQAQVIWAAKNTLTWYKNAIRRALK